ncbi:MAG: ABC transporter permease [Candidatus Poribacteria bacterium]|nr:ABC transporter permease [Candidatus Poribacteria bacterium]MDE0324108.1 ABC transporter permease [Candidatus Poribacteria bacterium]
MITYIVRRTLYAIPILIGVNLIVFFLFFIVNSPDQMARRILGEKNITQEDVDNWKKQNGYHLPLWFNAEASGTASFTETIFFEKSVKLFFFDFGTSDANNIDITSQISQRMWASLAIALPTFLVGVLVNITVSMIVAYYRATYVDFWGTIIAVILMSVSTLFYIIGGQWVFGKILRLFPISGYDSGVDMLKFVILPVVIGIIGGVGGGIRFYRTIFLEEVNRDYVRTARAKGLSEAVILFKHALKNAMIPILTNVVLVIPLLFMGSLVMEAFFAIPGLGSFTIEAIHAQDFAIVRSMVYLSSVLYIIGLLLTDISYTLVDPRVRLGAAAS